jgi:hypothetical protein
MDKEKINTYIKNLSKSNEFGVGLLDYFFAKWILTVKREESFNELLKALNYENQYIVFQVVDILGKTGNKQTIPYLKEMLKRTDLWGATMCSLGVALVRLGDKEGIEFLKKKIIDPKVHRDLRIDAARALIRLRVKGLFKEDEKINSENMSDEWKIFFNKLVEKLRNYK